MKNFICLSDFSQKELTEIINLAYRIKNRPSVFKEKLKGKNIALIFEKPSLRTKASFMVGAMKMGAGAVYFSPQEVRMGKREAVKDVSRVISGYFDAAVLRTFSHNAILEFAQYSRIPVINGLSDKFHPAQVLSDIFTILEKKNILGSVKKMAKLKIVFVGDPNNVFSSFVNAALIFDFKLLLAAPKNYTLPKQAEQAISAAGKKKQANIQVYHNAAYAVKEADVVYTDVWVSMGKEKEAKKRLKDFRKFQVNKKLLSYAKKDCLLMHCLPAHRGQEVTDETIEGNNSVVFKQAQNRLYLQQAIMLYLLGKV